MVVEEGPAGAVFGVVFVGVDGEGEVEGAVQGE